MGLRMLQPYNSRSTILHPESASGEHRIHPKPTDHSPAPTVSVQTRRRVDHVDLLCGSLNPSIGIPVGLNGSSASFGLSGAINFGR